MSQKLISVPLCQLQRSKANVRKTRAKENVKELAASIDAHGLLQNLTVRKAKSRNTKEVTYEVVAGGRRLAALQLLAKRKRIVRDAPVLCLVLDNDDATEVSLAENFARVPIHPADQFEAFSKLQADGCSTADTAARFGISETVVRQRLKLAAVSPKLMALYRADEMNLEQLVAFSITDDHEAQERAWFDVPEYSRSPQAIRRALTSSLVDGSDRRARFVGANAYEAAGGSIIRDLFDPEDGGYFEDSRLLDQLTAQKLSAEADAIRQEGWAWVEAMPEHDYEYLARFRRVPPDQDGLTSEERQRRDALSEQYDAMIGELEDDAPEDEQLQLDRIEAELSELSSRERQWSDEEKAESGAVVSLDYRGELSVTRGLVTPEPSGEGDLANCSKKRRGEDGGASGMNAGFSEALLVDLSAHRTAALHEELAGQPDVALLALLHTLVLRIFYGSTSELCVDMRPAIVDLKSLADTVTGSPAASAMAERQRHWREELPEAKQLWEWLVAQSDETRSDLLAYCVAATVNAVHRRHDNDDGERRGQSDRLADALSLDMANWWEPTKVGYLSRVSKASILRAVSEAISSQSAENLSSLKKDAMSQRAEELLAGKRWLPEPLRHRQIVAEAAE